MSKGKATLCWIAMIPAVILAGMLTSCINSWTLSYVQPELIHDLSKSPNFAGHYILGPITVFWVGFLSALVTIGVGSTIAPPGRRVVLIIFSVGTGLVCLSYSFLAYLIVKEYGAAHVDVDAVVRGGVMALSGLVAAIVAIVKGKEAIQQMEKGKKGRTSEIIQMICNANNIALLWSENYYVLR